MGISGKNILTLSSEMLIGVIECGDGAKPKQPFPQSAPAGKEPFLLRLGTAEFSDARAAALTFFFGCAGFFLRLFFLGLFLEDAMNGVLSD